MIMIAMPNRGVAIFPAKASFLLEQLKNVFPAISSPKSPGLESFQDPPGVLQSLHPLQNMDQRWIVQFQKQNVLICLDLWSAPGCLISFGIKTCATVHPSFLVKGMCITDRFTAPNQARVLQPDPCGEPLPHLRLRESNLPRTMCASGSNLKKS